MQKPFTPNFFIIAFLSAVHLLAIGGIWYLFTYGISWAEGIFLLTAYLLGGFGITALYHRSWTHNATKFSRPVEIFLAISSIFLLQNSAKLWITNHIRHHQHTDHDEDPYNIQKGFWWAHQNWVFFDRETPPLRLPERLQNNPVLHWQHRWYFPLSFMLNVLLPTAISVASGSPWWAGILLNALRLIVCNNIIYSVNSICHYFGSQPFSTRDSARNVWWYPFMLGEQYHNFHHTFPHDYRNGIRWYDFDPTKWLIWGAWKLGLATQPFVTEPEKISKTQAESGL